MKPSEITTEYKEVFQDTIGRLEGYQVIKIKDGAIAKKTCSANNSGTFTRRSKEGKLQEWKKKVL